MYFCELSALGEDIILLKMLVASPSTYSHSSHVGLRQNINVDTKGKGFIKFLKSNSVIERTRLLDHGSTIFNRSNHDETTIKP